MPRILGRIAVVIGITLIVLAGVAGEDYQEVLSSHLDYSVDFTVYYATPDGTALVPVHKSLPKWKWNELEALKMLAKDPGRTENLRNLVSPLPEGAEPVGIEIAGGVAVVDFNPALVERHSGGTTGEILTVYSIVNTLTGMPGIERVKITVGGEPIDTISGHLDLSVPLERDDSLILELSSN